MIWLACEGCAAEIVVDPTDGNTPDFDEDATTARTLAFVEVHAPCGILFRLRDSYGRSYEHMIPKAAS